ncbi:MAG: amino acid adenylation domain-containing protein [Tepidisphaera sp.]
MSEARTPHLLHFFFDKTAREHPAQIAVDVPPGPGRPERVLLTYADMLARADALAAVLTSFAWPDSVVGILLPRNSPWLYIAQLAVLKAGGAFTCLDPAFPDSHVEAVLKDGDVSVLLTDRGGIGRINAAGVRVHNLIDVTAPRAARVEPASPRALAPPKPENLAYVIYTSGTTGAPKGVMIEHRSIVNLVVSDIEEFGLTPGDRVGQGSSAAYDSSIEETWLAFAVGATLVVMDDHTSRMGPDLISWLRRERISVFCPPPTLLRTTGCDDPESALPDLKLLYVGGEALTEDLAERWGRGRRLVNGYGPTECTVTVVRGDVVSGRPVTIGRPVAGHSAWVLDSQLNPVADGEDGELCLSGVGLARGYRNREEVTREKFPVHPSLGRLYRTGDLVRREPDGELVYLGRIDAQVKLRGYRVELEAIEACLAQCPGVREAACRVQGDGSSAVLVAHIVATDADAPFDSATIKETLRGKLPPYMVPARFGLLESLPRSIGGKIDRKRLPELEPDLQDLTREVVTPSNELEATIVGAFASALRISTPISVQDDFFLALGGDSLSAVEVICTLRKNAQTASVTTRDLYETRTAAALAGILGAKRIKRPLLQPQRQAVDAGPARHVLTTAAQGLWILLQLIAVGAVGYAAVFDLLPLLLERFGLLGTILIEIPLVLASMVAYAASAIFVTVVLKLALIGEYRLIRTPVWSSYYLRHWIVQSAARTIPWDWLAGTTASGAVLRLLGAKVGRRVHVHRGVNLQQGGWDLLTLGDDVTLGHDAHVGLVSLESGCLCIGPVHIHDRATLDTRASVSGHTTIETGGYLTALSWLPEGERIPAGERWDGVPAAPDGHAPTAPKSDAGGRIHPHLYTLLHLLITGLVRSATPIPFLVALYALSQVLGVSAEQVQSWLSDPSWSAESTVVLAAVSVLSVPIGLVIRAIGIRCLGRVRPSIIHRWSLAYLRVWHKTAVVESAGMWLTGTLFWPQWLRLAGMKIGRGCEISTISDVVPENIRIGSNSFFADGIYLGGPRVHQGTVTISDTSLGRGTFLGNHVIIPAGATLPDDLFIGVCTVADAARARKGSSWFGHPSLELPRRDVVKVDPSLTHNPGMVRYCNRLFWESLRFTLPILPLAVVCLWMWAVTSTKAEGALLVLVVAPALTLAAIIAECFAVVALKWLLLGRTRAGQHPLWSCWCSRWDFLYVAWQFYALRPLAAVEGTLFLAMYLRAMGVRVGRRVVLGPGMAQVADPDMIIIEDDATVNANYQAHSFEDRMLKTAPVVVRRGATIGESAVVFYGADVGENAWVTPNSVVMKNERPAPGLSYSGCPVQSLDSGETDRKAPEPAPSVAELAAPTAPADRQPFLDVARGVAVLGMIYMHFVPAEKTEATLASVWTAISAFLEGKAAALFCVLAGIAWEIHAQRAAQSPHGRWYLPRRVLSLLLLGVAFHILAWPTEILVPFSLMMVLALGLRRLGRQTMLAAAVLLLLLAPAVPAFFGHYIESDWAEDGSHLADGSLGWVTVRALLFDGSYPILPWLAFPLIGMLMVPCWKCPPSNKRWFGSAVGVYLACQAFVYWVDSNAEAMNGLEAYLGSTWVPTSAMFVLITGSSAIAIISGLAWLRGAGGGGVGGVGGSGERASIQSLVALLGRASLTHYLLHICIVYLPLRTLLGHEDWSAQVGVWAFGGYVTLAVPLTALWFRRFKRGPVESLWAFASGS